MLGNEKTDKPEDESSPPGSSTVVLISKKPINDGSFEENYDKPVKKTGIKRDSTASKKDTATQRSFDRQPSTISDGDFDSLSVSSAQEEGDQLGALPSIGRRSPNVSSPPVTENGDINHNLLSSNHDFCVSNPKSKLTSLFSEVDGVPDNPRGSSDSDRLPNDSNNIQEKSSDESVRNGPDSHTSAPPTEPVPISSDAASALQELDDVLASDVASDRKLSVVEQAPVNAVKVPMQQNNRQKPSEINEKPPSGVAHRANKDPSVFAEDSNQHQANGTQVQHSSTLFLVTVKAFTG